MMSAMGIKSGRFDILDSAAPMHRRSNFMDLTHASGFVFLILIDLFLDGKQVVDLWKHDHPDQLTYIIL